MIDEPAAKWRIAEGYSAPVRPVISGCTGAVSAAHPLAVGAGQEILACGGSAVDAAIAAQAVLCVISPDACGIGGDLFAIIDDGVGQHAVSGAGAAPLGAKACTDDGAGSITVPGLAGAWAEMHRRWGKLDLATCLNRAVVIARDGLAVSPYLSRTLAIHDARLVKAGSVDSPWRNLAPGTRHRQPQLAALLQALGQHGAGWFYGEEVAEVITRRVQALGGGLNVADFIAHQTEIVPPLRVRFDGVDIYLQPPPTQGVLLGMVLNNLQSLQPKNPHAAEHIAIELTNASFAFRERAHEGATLLAQTLDIHTERAANRTGPRAYLHTAGVCVTDADGLAVSSLVSVFDDFGSCVFVPELGIFLNNRAGGFTSGPNAYAPGKKPVHTLAPAMIRSAKGKLAIATPGADGQVQTLLQCIDRMLRRDEDLATAIAAPRWRSQAGKLLIERNHPSAEALAAQGHDIEFMAPGAMCFGAVACAGVDNTGVPYAAGDWRRENWVGVI